MKNKIFVIAFTLGIISCNSNTKDYKSSEQQIRYVEQQTPFLDLFFFRIKDNEWIRQPKNIITVHETFKLGFYDEFLTDEVLDDKPYVNDSLYYNISLRTKIDSLQLTYGKENVGSRYYREFWQRRIAEKNDSVVFEVLVDVSKIIEGQTLSVNKNKTDDRLKNMVQIIADQKNGLSLTEGLHHFDLLNRMRMHQSAFNLVHESYLYQDLNWDKDSLTNLLKIQSDDSSYDILKDVFIQDDTK